MDVANLTDGLGSPTSTPYSVPDSQQTRTARIMGRV